MRKSIALSLIPIVLSAVLVGCVAAQPVYSSSLEEVLPPSSVTSEPLEWPMPVYDSDDLYRKLIGLEPSDLTIEDYSMLLNTSVAQLEDIYGLAPLDFPAKGSNDYELFLHYYNTQDLPIQHMLFQYQGDSADKPPALLNIASEDDVVLDIPLGSTFEEIAAIWGPAQRRLYNNAMGMWARQWQAVDYHRDGLVFSFRCMEPIYTTDYDVYSESDWSAIGDIPWDSFPQIVTRVVITLDDENQFYLWL